MERLSIFCLLLATVSSRVPDSPSVLALNNLLSRADPTDNEVYFEAPLTYDLDKQQDSPTDLDAINESPVQGETFSGSPKYVDTSEFRSQLRGVLPPFLDINRHLTLLRASSGRTIPEELVQPSTDEISNTNYEFLPRSASLLHGDFLRDEPIVEEEVLPEEVLPEEEEVVSSSLAFQKREPLSHPLSPLGHILAGFQSEMGPFGGDVSTSRFMSSFRPDDF